MRVLFRSESTLALVDDLTFATTFEAGKMHPAIPLSVHLPSMLQQAIKVVNAVEQRGGRSVEIRLRTEGFTSETEYRLVDPCLSRVIYNLLSNAVRYSPAAGQYVTLTVTHRDQINTQNSSLCSKRTRSASFEENIKCTNQEETNGPNADSGTFTFHFENSTTSPLDVTLVRNYFSYYYHSDYTVLNDSPIESRQWDEQNTVNRSGTQTPTLSTASSEVDVRSPVRLNSSSIYKDLNSVKGLGLGLYTAYSMVKLMGGQLQCSADTPDKACFWFTVTLPASVTELATVQPLPKVVEAEPLLALDNGAICDTLFEIQRQMRVLVVDDSSTCQKVIVKSLKGLEFQIDVASNGWEACEKLQHTPCQFDAVLMDLRMPVMDGLEATRYCREVLKLLSLPIIAITAEIGSSIREEAIKAGASHFLSKPAKAQEIISILRSLDAHTLPCNTWPNSLPSPPRGLSCV